jgi:hypothetical protein
MEILVDMKTATSQLKECSCKRHDQYRHCLVSVFRRFSATCLTIILLVICLYLYSKIENLNKWHQRGFNTLAILLTGTMSICIGSLLGYLGCMIRWPILARAAHKAREVCILPLPKLVVPVTE